MSLSSCLRVLLGFGCSIAASVATGTERSCHVSGLETPVACVTLAVPRDYDRPDAGALALTAVVIPATTARAAPDPVFVLAGGPGQAASSVAGYLSAAIANVRRSRDVVLFDIRGTGLSERLDCSMPTPPVRGSEAPHPDSLAAMRAMAAQCAQTLGERAWNHTDREVVEDLERFRAARGYQQINLWGGSYGTRIAQHFVRAYGKHVRSAVLDGVTPVASSALVTMAHTPDAALARLFERCSTDVACAAAFPDLSTKFARLLRETGRQPLVVPSDAGGRSNTVVFDYVALTDTVRFALYGRVTTELLPLAIASAVTGNFKPLIGLSRAMFDPDAVALGAQFSMLCAEDWPLAQRAGADARTGGFMRDGYYQLFTSVCEAWPREELPPAMLTRFSSNVPVLAISGDADPATPPQLAEQALEQFTMSVHLIVPLGFHVNSHDPCVARIIASFFADPVQGGRDHACVAGSPPLHFSTGDQP